LPEEEAVPPTCLTDAVGRCTWHINRGLYQVLFERPLDDISTLALAEGGLRGLGITVGDEDIIYHFTFHSDGRVYFDAAPDAAIPSAIMPVGDVLQGGIKPTLTPPPSTSLRTESGLGESMPETSTPEPTVEPETAVEPTSSSSWHLILFIGGGLVIGGGLHLLRRRSESALSLPKGQVWSRQRQTPNRKSKMSLDATASRTVNRQSEPPHA
jgi:hypothetical protein